MNADTDQADIQRIRDEIRASRRMTDLERLQWLEEICVFANMFRQAPEQKIQKQELNRQGRQEFFSIPARRVRQEIQEIKIEPPRPPRAPRNSRN